MRQQLFSTNSSKFLHKQKMYSEKKWSDGLDLQGHRGCRGLMPENTIPAFLKALELGVTTLEMDVVITKDKNVLVSHDTFMSHEFCLRPDGTSFSEQEEKKYNIYGMNMDEITQWDCGSKPHPRFPQQKKVKVYKPLLQEVIRASEEYADTHSRPEIFYNIEIKSVPAEDGICHPPFREFTDLVMKVLKENNIISRTTIQSFDLRPLQYLHHHYKEKVSLSLLIENSDNFKEKFDILGFIPDIYSPECLLVDEALIRFLKKNHVRLIPWTVNNLPDMKKLIKMGVDGLISDYPDLYKNL
jgi:glycerophosphoryl diester phosphodiesterase